MALTGSARPCCRGQDSLGQRLPGRNPDLLVDEVEVSDQLGHAVLDLEPGVDLEKPEVAVGREQELGRRGVAQPDRARDLDAQLVEAAALLRRQARSRRLLDQLLVAALDRAVAFAEGDDLCRASSPSSWTSTWRARST